jgi:hypothetical protein
VARPKHRRCAANDHNKQQQAHVLGRARRAAPRPALQRAGDAVIRGGALCASGRKLLGSCRARRSTDGASVAAPAAWVSGAAAFRAFRPICGRACAILPQLAAVRLLQCPQVWSGQGLDVVRFLLFLLLLLLLLLLPLLLLLYLWQIISHSGVQRLLLLLPLLLLLLLSLAGLSFLFLRHSLAAWLLPLIILCDLLQKVVVV